MIKRTAYLGPKLSFCEQAAKLHTGQEQGEMLECSTIAGVFAAVEEGKAWQGIVPIENSCEGSVNETLDLLAYDSGLAITGEIIMPVKHHVMVREGLRTEEIGVIDILVNNAGIIKRVPMQTLITYLPLGASANCA